MSTKLITIGIPTHNRAAYLDRCLKELLKQANDFIDLIEFQVSDNASSDNTEAVVKKYKDLGYSIDYFKHINNVGMDKNFISLYNRCNTKYMWMLSDDDFLLPDALSNIMNLLQRETLGVLYLNHLWFDKELNMADVRIEKDNIYTKYEDPLLFVDRVNYWFTFISGNIINKDAVKGKVNFDALDGTFLALIGWIIPAVFQGLPNYVIENHNLACKANNAGGYKLFKVFGENFNFSMDVLIKQGCNKRIKDIINNHLLTSFFPIFLNKENPNFLKENYIPSLLPVFWRYKQFWKNIFPSLIKQKLRIG